MTVITDRCQTPVSKSCLWLNQLHYCCPYGVTRQISQLASGSGYRTRLLSVAVLTVCVIALVQSDARAGSSQTRSADVTGPDEDDQV